MELDLFLRGTMLGFAIAAAVGPIALLTIRRTLAQGVAVGLASGLGVATADGIYGGIAAFGLTAVSDLLVGQARPLALVGGVALLVLGIRTIRSVPASPPAGQPAARAPRDLASAYASMLGLTLTNPMTIVSFTALFAGFGAASTLGGATALTAGVFGGSAAWWVVLLALVTVARTRLTPGVLRVVNRLSGTAIAAFGAVTLVVAAVGT